MTSVKARLTDDEVAEKLAAAAPPLTSQQRATLAALWRQHAEPCRPNATSRRNT